MADVEKAPCCAESQDCCKEQSCCDSAKGPCHPEGGSCPDATGKKKCGCKVGQDCKCSDGKCEC